MRRLTVYECSRIMAVLLPLAAIIYLIRDAIRHGPTTPFNYMLCAIFTFAMWYVWRWLALYLDRFFNRVFGHSDRRVGP